MITIDHPTFPCYIIERCETKHLCGYIAVPLGHPWHGKSYDDFESSVHGGLTYSSDKLHASDGGSDVSIPLGSWVFGFDCAHAGDGVYGPPGEARRDEVYVRAELESLRSQAEAATT